MRAVTMDNGQETLLVPRAKRGDRAAFDALFDRHRQRLGHFILSRLQPDLRERLDVGEILQDTLVRAFQSIDRFLGNDETEFRRWITGIANNAVARAEEQACRRRTLLLDRDVAARSPTPSKVQRRHERFDRLQKSVDALSDDHRTVLLLTRIEGLSIRQAAERMGRTEAAVKMLFLRALKNLRGTMSETESLTLPDRQLEERGGSDARPSEA